MENISSLKWNTTKSAERSMHLKKHYISNKWMMFSPWNVPDAKRIVGQKAG